MADIFDTLDAPAAEPKGDIFDQVAAPPAGDIFDQVSSTPAAQDAPQSSTPTSTPISTSDPEVDAFLKATTTAGGDLSQFLRPASPSALSPSIVETENEPVGVDEFFHERLPIYKAVAEVPLIELPKPQNTGVGTGIVRGLEGGVESMATLENASIIGGLAKAPLAIQRIASGLFSGKMLKDAVDQFGEAAKGETPGERAEGYTKSILSLLLSGFAAKHAFGRPGGGGVLTGESRPESLTQEQADTATQMPGLTPESVPLTKEHFPIDSDTLDGLVKTREALVKEMQQKSPGETDQIQPYIDHIDDTLLKADHEQVKASEARIAAQRAQTPPTEGEAPPVTAGGPPTKGGTSSLFRQAQAEAGGAPYIFDQVSLEPTPEAPTPPVEPTPEAPAEPPAKIEDPAMHQAALDSAERIATQVTQGQGDIVQRAARDAAYDKIKKNMEGGHPTMSFVRQAAEEAAGKEKAKAGVSLEAENETGQSVGDQVASEELTPSQSAAKADMVDAVQKQVETLPEDIRGTAKAFLEAAQNGDSTSLRDLGEKLGVSQQTVANHLKKMQSAFKGLKEEGYSVGPGAASISEQLGETLRSIKNASTEAGREAAGLPERDAVGRRTFGEIWDNALKAFDDDPEVGKKLVGELNEKSRPLTDREDAILTHELADRQQEYDEALHDVAEAKTPEENAAAKTRLDDAAAKTRLDDARSALHEVYDVSEKAGTENARGLSARRMMIRSDYSMMGVERKLRDTLGRDVTDEERAKVEKPVQEVEKADEKAKAAEEDYQKSKEGEETEHFVEATINELGKSYLEKPAYGKKVFDIARGIVDRWKEEAKTAHDDLRKALGSANAGIPNPAIVLHVAKILRAKIGEFGLDKTEAFAEMVKEYGPKVQEHLEKGWKQAKALIAGEKGPDKAKEVAGKGLGKKGEKTPVEAKAAAKAEAVAGDKLSQKTIVDHVRALINAGEHDTNTLMAKATEAMKEHFPDVTERDVRRAFVEYGKKIFPSKEAVEVEIRENKQIVKIQEDIDREMEGQKGIVNPETGELMGAEKQGYQRDKATQRVRDLIKQRNELLKKRAGPPSPEKLASRDEAKQTALKNQIEDLDKQLRTGEKLSTKGEPAPDSAQTEQLRAERDAMKAKLDEIEKEANPPKSPDEKYNENRVKQIQKDLAEKQVYLDQLKKTGVVPPKPSVAAKTKFAATAKAEAELMAKRREVDDAIRKIAYDNRSTPAKVKEGALTALKLVTSVKILGHGTVGMFTHAGGLAWRPTVAKTFWTNFGRQFKLWTDKAYHEQAVYKLKNDPDFQTWKDAGASIDPEQTYTDYGLYAKWLGKLGEAGGRGFDALKLTRLELNKATWDKVPDSVKNDPVAAAETRKAIADINNKATGAIPRVSPVTPEGSPNRITNGVYNLAKNPVADALFFAPKLYASRWARVVLDPVKTVGTLANWKNASIADKTAAKIRMKNAGQFAAVYVGALLVNQGLLKASGSNQSVNINDPTKADWLKFKGAGKEIVADGGLLDPLRLLGQVVVGDILNVRTKNQQYREGTRYQKITEDLGKYARSKFNPTLGLAVDATTGTDYAGKPLPFSNEPPKYKDQGKYTWPEWLMQQGPIPISQGTRVAYDEMRKNGMSHLQIMQLLKGAAVAAIGGTGVHVTEDHPHVGTDQQSGTKRSPLRR